MFYNVNSLSIEIKRQNINVDVEDFQEFAVSGNDIFFSSTKINSKSQSAYSEN